MPTMEDTRAGHSILKEKAETRLSQALELVMAFMVTGHAFDDFRIQKRAGRTPAETPYVKDVYDFTPPTETPGKFRITVENWNDASQAPKLETLPTDETEEQAAESQRDPDMDTNPQFD